MWQTVVTYHLLLFAAIVVWVSNISSARGVGYLMAIDFVRRCREKCVLKLLFPGGSDKGFAGNSDMHKFFQLRPPSAEYNLKGRILLSLPAVVYQHYQLLLSGFPWEGRFGKRDSVAEGSWFPCEIHTRTHWTSCKGVPLPAFDSRPCSPSSLVSNSVDPHNCSG